MSKYELEAGRAKNRLWNGRPLKAPQAQVFGICTPFLRRPEDNTNCIALAGPIPEWPRGGIALDVGMFRVNAQCESRDSANGSFSQTPPSPNPDHLF